MGISLLSALQIQGNDTLVVAYQDKNSGKFGYAITHNEDRYCRPIISCAPVYDSGDEALKEGRIFEKKIKKLDLIPQRKSLVDAVGGPEIAKTIDAIVRASKR